jgi:transcriptional regulator with XRE-family HTH domain
MDHLIHTAERQQVAISKDEREFFVQLGGRVAELRKREGMTQAQLAETLEVSQQTVNAYESGQRRVPVSMLPALAHTFGVSVEELIGSPSPRTARKRGPTPTLQRHMERISALPKQRQRAVVDVIEAMLQQHAR